MKHNPCPFFSIIIPTYQRPAQLEQCLRAITRLDYPANRFEVVVVNDGSRGHPEKVVAPFAARINVTLLKADHNGPATARNIGAAGAKGEFLVFTDDDCLPLPNWLQSFSKCFSEAPDGLIGGRTLNSLPDNPYSTAGQLLCDYLYAAYNADCQNARFLTSNNLGLKRQHFTRIGGFDANFRWAGGEDREFSRRWRHHGRRIIYAPEAAILHHHALTFNTFFRQHFIYGRGAFLFHRKQKDLSERFTKWEHLLFYSRLLRYPYQRPFNRRTAHCGALFMVSQVAVAAGYFSEWMNKVSNLY